MTYEAITDKITTINLPELEAEILTGMGDDPTIPFDIDGPVSPTREQSYQRVLRLLGGQPGSLATVEQIGGVSQSDEAVA